MPRYLGKDYFQEEFTARREFGARSNLIVPSRFEEDGEQCTNQRLQDIFKTFQPELESRLQDFDVPDDANWSTVEEESPEPVCHVEPLEWATRWKEFEGNYVEIVPSSNPESHSSFSDSQPDSQTNASAPEEFCTEPLPDVSKEESCYLEEPVTTTFPISSSQSTRFDVVLESVFNNFELDNLWMQTEIPEDERTVSEKTAFGGSDQQFQTIAGEEKSPVPDPQVYTEKFEKDQFEEARAEELLCPVNFGDSSFSLPPASQTEVVINARSLCSVEYEARLLPSSPVNINADADVRELVLHQKDEKHRLETVVLSPVAKPESPDFVDLNAMQHEAADGDRGGEKVLESPLYIHNVSPALPHFTDSYAKDTVSLTAWSPNLLTTKSPLLKDQDVSKLQATVRQSEAAFDAVQNLKFREPDLEKEIKDTEPLLNTVTDALHLAKSVDCGGSLGRLELDLTWDITPVASSLPCLASAEPLTVTHDQPLNQQPVVWTASLDIESIEAVVERDMAKKPSNEPEVRKENTVKPLKPQSHRSEGLLNGRSAVSLLNKVEQDEKSLEGSTTTKQGVCCSKLYSAPLPKPVLGKTSEQIRYGETAKYVPSVSTLGFGQDNCNIETAQGGQQQPQRHMPHFATEKVSNEPCRSDSNNAEILSKTAEDTYGQRSCMTQNSSQQSRDAYFQSLKPAKPSQLPQGPRHNILLNTPAVLSSTTQSDTAPGPKSPQQSVESVILHSEMPSLAKSYCLRSERNAGDAVKQSGRTVENDGDHCTRESEPEDSTPEGFHIQLDDEDTSLGSDFSSDHDKSTGSIDAPYGKKPARDGGETGRLPFDPVEHFLMLRDAKTTANTVSRDVIKGQTVVKAVPRVERRSSCHPGVITPMSVVPRSVSDSEQRLVNVSLSVPEGTGGDYQPGRPHLQWLKAAGVVAPDATFLSLRPDYTRFLFKDKAKKMEHVERDDCEDETYKHIAVIHALRLTAHSLEHCCLESAIVLLSNMQDKYPVITDTVQGLRKSLFQLQFTAQQSGQLHPKVAAVCREIQQHKHTCPVSRMAVVVRHEQVILVKVLQAAISADGTLTMTATPEDGSWPEECECLITWEQTTVTKLAPYCTLVLDFEADKDSALCKTCTTENVNYVGLCTIEIGSHQNQDKQVSHAAFKLTSSDENCITVVGSQQLIQNQQLLQLLETRHNVMVVRRDYTSIGLVHYPDVLASAQKGAVLLEAEQLREEGGLERLTEKLTALGLHLSTVWILVHAMGDTNRTLLARNTLKKLVQLQALTSNLSVAAKGFTATYKTLLCRTAGEVASYLAHLASSSDAKHVTTNTSEVSTNLQLPPEMTKEEKFLLGIPCLNSFSCHMILSRASLGEVLAMSRDQLHSLLPELTDGVIENLHRVVSMDRGLQLRQPSLDSHPSRPGPRGTTDTRTHNQPVEQSYNHSHQLYNHSNQQVTQPYNQPSQPGPQPYNSSSQPLTQPYIQHNQPSAHSYIDLTTSSRPCPLNEASDLATPAKRGSAFLGSEDQSAVMTSLERPGSAPVGDKITSCDFVSPEVSQQHCVVSSSSNSHYRGDKPTPFLLPGAQQRNTERSRFQDMDPHRTQQTGEYSTAWLKEPPRVSEPGPPPLNDFAYRSSPGNQFGDYEEENSLPKKRAHRDVSDRAFSSQTGALDSSVTYQDVPGSSNWQPQTHLNARCNRPKAEPMKSGVSQYLRDERDTLNSGSTERAELLLPQNIPQSVQGHQSFFLGMTQRRNLSHDFDSENSYSQDNFDDGRFWSRYQTESNRGPVHNGGASLYSDQGYASFPALSEIERHEARTGTLLRRNDQREAWEPANNLSSYDFSGDRLSHLLPSAQSHQERSTRVPEFGSDSTFSSKQFAQPFSTSSFRSRWPAQEAEHHADLERRGSSYAPSRFLDDGNFAMESRDLHGFGAAENLSDRWPIALRFKQNSTLADSRKETQASDRFTDESSRCQRPLVPRSQNYGYSEEPRYSATSFNDDLAAATRRLLAGRSRSRAFCTAAIDLAPLHTASVLAWPSHSAENSKITAAAKLKKWSVQLWSNQEQHGSVYSNNASDDVCPSTEKKRAVEDKKLTYRPVPGTGGQTKLTFL